MNKLSFLYLLLSYQAFSMETPISITGNVVIPPCTINGGKQIEINYSRININEVDGRNFPISQTVEISCDYYSDAASVTISGEKISGAPDNVLRANVDGATTQEFGLAFYQGSSVSENNQIELGVKKTITTGLSGINTHSGSFTFTVVPWKTAGWSQVGEFNAAASLSISYL